MKTKGVWGEQRVHFLLSRSVCREYDSCLFIIKLEQGKWAAGYTKWSVVAIAEYVEACAHVDHNNNASEQGTGSQRRTEPILPLSLIGF